MAYENKLTGQLAADRCSERALRHGHNRYGGRAGELLSPGLAARGHTGVVKTGTVQVACQALKCDRAKLTLCAIGVER